jgi:hypothetical protein
MIVLSFGGIHGVEYIERLSGLCAVVGAEPDRLRY